MFGVEPRSCRTSMRSQTVIRSFVCWRMVWMVPAATYGLPCSSLPAASASSYGPLGVAAAGSAGAVASGSSSVGITVRGKFNFDMDLCLGEDASGAPALPQLGLVDSIEAPPQRGGTLYFQLRSAAATRRRVDF